MSIRCQSPLWVKSGLSGERRLRLLLGAKQTLSSRKRTSTPVIGSSAHKAHIRTSFALHCAAMPPGETVERFCESGERRSRQRGGRTGAPTTRRRRDTAAIRNRELARRGVVGWDPKWLRIDRQKGSSCCAFRSPWNFMARFVVSNERKLEASLQTELQTNGITPARTS